MDKQKIMEWVEICLKSLGESKLSDHDALLGAQNIWANIIVYAYKEYLKVTEDKKPLTFKEVVEIELDKMANVGNAIYSSFQNIKENKDYEVKVFKFKSKENPTVIM